MFCECDKVRPLWDNLSAFIDKKCGENLDLSNFQKMFGMDLLCSEHTRGINFLILYLKFWKKYTSSPRYWYTSIGQY